MRSTPEIETKEIADARAALQRARRGLAQAQRNVAEEQRDAIGAGPPTSSPLADAADTQWVRVALLERRERDAVAAHAHGDRSRGRTRRWRRLIGLHPAPPPTVQEATTSFLDQDALARDALAQKNAERDARDA